MIMIFIQFWGLSNYKWISNKIQKIEFSYTYDRKFEIWVYIFWKLKNTINFEFIIKETCVHDTLDVNTCLIM